jgi:hypothetical protein
MATTADNSVIFVFNLMNLPHKKNGAAEAAPKATGRPVGDFQ